MSFHRYAIQEIFSNADGTVQFIELAVGNFNGESFWNGQTLTVTRTGQPTHQFAFASNLPSNLTANTTVLVATQGFADLGLVTPDFIVPAGFLYTQGGTVNFANVDAVTYGALPTDGVHSVNRSGSVADASPRNFAGQTHSFSHEIVIDGTAASELVAGSDADETLNGLGGNDTLNGAGGNDSIDGGSGTDTAQFSGTRAGAQLSRSGGTITVVDGQGTDTVVNCELLRFDDRSVDLGMGARAASIPAATLQTLEELYVGFFNRIPEAQGLGFWIDQLAAGMSMAEVADEFYNAGVSFGVYSATMSKEAFIAQVYDYVLGRPSNGPKPPTEDDIDFWLNYLKEAGHSKGTMVLRMLSDTHAFFTGDLEVGFVADLLDNKASVANYYAVQQGLGLHVPADNIAFGVTLADLITPDNTSAAIAFIGVNSFSLL